MATLVRWEPFREIATLQNDMSRLMNAGLGDTQDTARNWVPPVDVWETGDELVYAFDLPVFPKTRSPSSSRTARWSSPASASARRRSRARSSIASSGASELSRGPSACLRA